MVPGYSSPAVPPQLGTTVTAGRALTPGQDEAIDLAVLQVIHLKGLLPPESVTALVDEAADHLMSRLTAREFVVAQANGLRLSSIGKTWLREQLGLERSTVDLDRISSLYLDFDEPNLALKGIVSDWQIRPDGTPNDHSDSRYDAGVIARLADLHEQAGSLVDAITVAIPRLWLYPIRLARALTRLAGGEHRWFANPMIDSYHQVWFELHEDLLGVLDRNRIDEARAGRA